MVTKFVLLAAVLYAPSLAAQDSLQRKKDMELYGDYSKFHGTRPVNPIKSDPLKAIIVINNRIYQDNSLELANIRFSDYDLVQQIFDSTSRAVVKRILIYKSKKQ